MAPVSQRSAARMKGVTPGAVSRAAAPGGPLYPARLNDAKLDTAHPSFATWLGSSWRSRKRGSSMVAPAADVLALPSGCVIVTRAAWRVLRGDDDQLARAALATLIEHWRLPPHEDVPDALEHVSLAVGRFDVNARQYQILRTAEDPAARAALDVCIRRLGCNAEASPNA